MSNPSIYMAASGGMAQYERLEHLSNNIANIDTTGFKATRSIFSTERPDYASQLRLGPLPGSDGANRALSFAKLSEVQTDFTHGQLVETGNPLDVALGGEGFFAVDGPEGPLYTRAGSFSISKDGFLITKNGMTVQGEGGPIRLKSTPKRIDPDGTIHTKDGPIARLKVVNFEDDTHFKRVGMALFRPVNESGETATPTLAGHPQVLQGSLEGSNVNPISAMVELISAQRAFEQFNKSLTTLDELEKESVQQMARPR